MKRYKAFLQFLANPTIPVPIADFGVNLLLAGIFSLLLGYLYTYYGTSLSNRRMFSRNFPLLTMTTMFIITVVRSSLALSLGLVGALSIVRFRAAVKDPEELSFIFLAIGIGLGFGAGQRQITMVTFLVVALSILFRSLSHTFENGQNMLLTVTFPKAPDVTLERIVAVLRENGARNSLKRFDETGEMMEALFVVEFRNLRELNRTKNALQQMNPGTRISFVDNKGIL